MFSLNDCTKKEGIVYKNQFHVVFCPKYRRKVLTNGVDTRLREILTQLAAEKDIEIKEMEIKPDHVHLFIEMDPRLLLHKVIKDFKNASSSILREEFPSLKTRLPSLWTRSYLSCSVGQISETLINQFVEIQKKA